MPGILLIAATTGYQTRAFADAARRLSIPLTLATDRCHILENPWRDNAIPVRFDAAEESARGLASAVTDSCIEGIVAVADGPTVIAALTARHLNIPWHSPEAASACRDKHRMRQLFERAGLPVPRYAFADPGMEPEYPCVLKPLGLSASRGVIRANNRAEMEAAFRRIRRIAGPEERIQVEEYIPGHEYALEGLVTGGELQTLALFDKPDPLEGPYFEETIYVTTETRAGIVETCARAVRALGLTQGPIHAEMRVNERGVYMLEIAARPIGGLCSRALRFSTGMARGDPQQAALGLAEVILLHSIGRMPRELSPATPASGVMMIPIPKAGVLQSVEGVDKARCVRFVTDVVITAKPGETLVPLPEGASYPGFIFAEGPDSAGVESALRAAHGELRFDILATLPQLA